MIDAPQVTRNAAQLAAVIRTVWGAAECHPRSPAP
jgi:hypothetical protein